MDLPNKLRTFTLEGTVFICGAMVMTFEIIGSRILSPYIGASTYVWTSLIGVILGSLSFGYWLGGRLADRKPDIKILSSVIFFAGGLIAITVLVKEIVLSLVATAPVGIELRSLIASILLFAPASVALGIVTPYSIKLRLDSLSDTGKTVGRLYALSTIGSILGTFAAGFLLIPFVGSLRTLYGIAGILIVVSIVLAPFSATRRNLAVLIIFAFSIVSSEVNAYILYRASDLYDIDTEYSRVQIFQTTDPKTGKPIRALATDPYFTQSAMFLDSDEPALEYSRFYHLARHFSPDYAKVLVIGGAGYSVPKDFIRRYEDVKVDVVEIDPSMTAIARRFFRLENNDRLRIVHEDARTFLNANKSGTYDVILMDAFGSLFTVPYQLTTIEAVREISRSLKDNGLVIINLGSALKGPGSEFLQAELATYKSVFPQVSVYKVNSEYEDERLQNLMIVATRSTQGQSYASPDPEMSQLMQNRYVGDIPQTLPIITDDLAPVEFYNSIAQNRYLQERLK